MHKIHDWFSDTRLNKPLIDILILGAQHIFSYFYSVFSAVRWQNHSNFERKPNVHTCVTRCNWRNWTFERRNARKYDGRAKFDYSILAPFSVTSRVVRFTCSIRCDIRSVISWMNRFPFLVVSVQFSFVTSKLGGLVDDRVWGSETIL